MTWAQVIFLGVESRAQVRLQCSAAEIAQMNGDAESGHNQECAICYTYRLPLAGPDTGDGGSSAMATEPAANDPSVPAAGRIPDEVCGGVQCGRSFHRNCLVEWLRSVPGHRQSFGTLFGTCPYCTGKISVKLG